MVGTFFPVTPVSAEQANPYAGLISRAMDNYMKGQKAKYSSRQHEADIFSKEIGPLAALAANPNMMALHPEIQDSINARIKQYMAQKQGSSQHGILNNLFGNHPAEQQEQGNINQLRQNYAPQQLNNNGDDQNQYNESADNPSSQEKKIPLLPGQDRGIQGGAQANAETPFRTSAVKPGSLYQTEGGDVISAPTGEATANAQKTITAIKNIKPILKDLIDESKPFLEKGGALGVLRGQTAGLARKYNAPDWVSEKIGNRQLAGDYAQFQTDLAQATDTMIGALNLPSNMESTHLIQSIVTPQPGEDEKTYPARVEKELMRLARRQEMAKSVIGSGFKLNGGKNNSTQNSGKTDYTKMSADELNRLYLESQ